LDGTKMSGKRNGNATKHVLTSGIEFGRKDLRSIPKVFLIDAYEVS